MVLQQIKQIYEFMQDHLMASVDSISCIESPWPEHIDSSPKGKPNTANS